MPFRSSYSSESETEDETLKAIRVSLWNKLARLTVVKILHPSFIYAGTREYLSGKYHCTINLLFDWFGLVCFENKNKNC